MAASVLAATVIWLAGCAGAPPRGPAEASTASLQLPRSATVDCRIESLAAMTGNGGCLPTTDRARVALDPGRYRLVLACSRDAGPWWTPAGVETRHRFDLVVEAGRRYVVEMSNASAGSSSGRSRPRRR